MIIIGIITTILAFLGAPLFIIISANALFQFHRAGYDITLTAIEMYRLANMPMLLPIPLFTLSGYILAQSGAPTRLLRLSQASFGWMPAGLAAICISVCALFTALTGASGVTIIALGGLLLPALLEEKYPEKFSLGLITASGSLGLLFPPSLPMILYGVVAGTSVDELFLAGLFPGLLMIVLMTIFSAWYAVRHKVLKVPFSFQKLKTALWNAKLEIPLPFLILGSIYSGKIAVSEAAALTAFVVILIEVVIHREIAWSQIPDLMRRSMILVGGILIIMGCSLAYTNYLLDAEVPMKILDSIRVHIDSRLAFLILLNIFLLIVGCMLDIFSALVVVVPLIIPIAANYGIHPVHLGIIFLTNLNIGYLTPPVGLNLFISSLRFKKPVIDLYWASIPFLLMMLVSLIIVTYWPSLSLFMLE